jgi:hypothetical protein
MIFAPVFRDSWLYRVGPCSFPFRRSIRVSRDGRVPLRWDQLIVRWHLIYKIKSNTGCMVWGQCWPRRQSVWREKTQSRSTGAQESDSCITHSRTLRTTLRCIWSPRGWKANIVLFPCFRVELRTKIGSIVTPNTNIPPRLHSKLNVIVRISVAEREG